jgi:hypothetical protein
VKISLSKLATIFVIGIGLFILLAILWPIAQASLSSWRFDTLFSERSENTPKSIDIKIGENRVVLHKDTKSYIEFLQILHYARSQSAFDYAGQIPDLSSGRTPYGEIAISQYGITSHFKITQSVKNQNYFWIAVPKSDNQGTHLPLFAFGTALKNLVEQGAAANP